MPIGCAASAAAAPAVAWRGPVPPSGTALPSRRPHLPAESRPAGFAAPLPRVGEPRTANFGRGDPGSRGTTIEFAHGHPAVVMSAAAGLRGDAAPARIRPWPSPTSLSSPHHRQPCAPSGDPDDELRLRAEALGGLGQVPAVPDLDLRVRACRGRQGVLRARLRPAREGAGGRAGPDPPASTTPTSRSSRTGWACGTAPNSRSCSRAAWPRSLPPCGLFCARAP